MPMFRAADIPTIPGIALDRALARASFTRHLTDAEADDRLETAQHECSHLVAGIACGASATELLIRPPGSRKSAGVAQVGCLIDAHEAFVSMCGVAWEELNGKSYRAADDWRRGESEARVAGIDVHAVHAASRIFVDAVQGPIRDAAVGVLGLLSRRGEVPLAKLDALVQWLRPSVPDVRRGLAEAVGYADETLRRWPERSTPALRCDFGLTPGLGL